MERLLSIVLAVEENRFVAWRFYRSRVLVMNRHCVIVCDVACSSVLGPAENCLRSESGGGV
jgi:uncharacterized membrane protein